MCLSYNKYGEERDITSDQEREKKMERTVTVVSPALAASSTVQSIQETPRGYLLSVLHPDALVGYAGPAPASAPSLLVVYTCRSLQRASLRLLELHCHT